MSNSPFLRSVQDYMLVRRYSRRTVKSYLYWIKYFIIFHCKRHPSELGAAEVEAFLTYLAVERKVAAATQSIALNALAFLYMKFFDKPLGDVGAFRRSSRQRKLPEVLARAEVAQLLSVLEGRNRLMAALLYGSGLRRIELIRLRVKDVDLNHLQIRIWNGKGAKHRLTTLAPELGPQLKRQRQRVADLLADDIQVAGYAGVWMPDALAKKYPAAPFELGWQFLFPSSRLSLEPGTTYLRRHHFDEAARSAPLDKGRGWIRRSVATHSVILLRRIFCRAALISGPYSSN